jgi:putative ATP-dependent endonuclease of OLD family
MKIEKLILENFRGYQEKTEINFNSFNVIVGRNDIGKSTILESIDIFINDKSAVSKYEKADINMKGGNESKIGIVFSDLPKTLIVDATVETSLENELLLNGAGLLEIHKTFGATGVKKIDIVAVHPSHPKAKDLLSLKIDELKQRAENLNVPKEIYNGTISSSIRDAIRKHLGADLKNTLRPVTVFKTSDKTQSVGKEIWNQLESYFPIYSLFQSDRKNEEKDSEVQNPMKTVIKHILKDNGLQKQLKEVREAVEKASSEVAKLTIEKLKEMNTEIANTLNPIFSEPTWDSAFKFNLLSDDDIPLDKRGSGVRRLILLNFFRAEAEKQRKSRSVPHIIYALEEPETSQHPQHQLLLIEAFKTIAKNTNNQVILTTHSPGIAKQIEPESLIFLEKIEGKITVPSSDDDIFRKVANELGVLPSIELEDISKVKLAICVEGKNDVEFLKKICAGVAELKSICDLENAESVIILPLGGSSLQFWVNQDYLGKLNLNQIHIYDSDIGSDEPNKYQKYVDAINAKGEGNIAFVTTHRAMENLFPPSLITEIYGVQIQKDSDWRTIDVADIIGKHNLENSESPKIWDELEKEEKKNRTGKIKNQLNNIHSEKITKKHLDEINCFEEVKLWFDTINELK